LDGEGAEVEGLVMEGAERDSIGDAVRAIEGKPPNVRCLHADRERREAEMEFDAAEGAAITVGGQDAVAEIGVADSLLGSRRRGGGRTRQIKPDSIGDVLVKRWREVLVKNGVCHAIYESGVGLKGSADICAELPGHPRTHFPQPWR